MRFVQYNRPFFTKEQQTLLTITVLNNLLTVQPKHHLGKVEISKSKILWSLDGIWVNLGKLQYFTNLNLAAIKGDDVPYKNHDSRARSQSWWNLPRCYWNCPGHTGEAQPNAVRHVDLVDGRFVASTCHYDCGVNAMCRWKMAQWLADSDGKNMKKSQKSWGSPHFWPSYFELPQKSRSKPKHPIEASRPFRRPERSQTSAAIQEMRVMFKKDHKLGGTLKYIYIYDHICMSVLVYHIYLI